MNLRERKMMNLKEKRMKNEIVWINGKKSEK